MPPFRCTNLPLTTTPSSLTFHLSSTVLRPGESLTITDLTFVPSPASPSPRSNSDSQTAIFNVSTPLPKFFETLEGSVDRITVSNPGYSGKARVWMNTHAMTVEDGREVEVDARFGGFTQVSQGKEAGEVKAEYV